MPQHERFLAVQADAILTFGLHLLPIRLHILLVRYSGFFSLFLIFLDIIIYFSHIRRAELSFVRFQNIFIALFMAGKLVQTTVSALSDLFTLDTLQSSHSISTTE